MRDGEYQTSIGKYLREVQIKYGVDLSSLYKNRRRIGGSPESGSQGLGARRGTVQWFALALGMTPHSP